MSKIFKRPRMVKTGGEFISFHRLQELKFKLIKRYIILNFALPYPQLRVFKCSLKLLEKLFNEQHQNSAEDLTVSVGSMKLKYYKPMFWQCPLFTYQLIWISLFWLVEILPVLFACYYLVSKNILLRNLWKNLQWVGTKVKIVYSDNSNNVMQKYRPLSIRNIIEFLTEGYCKQSSVLSSAVTQKFLCNHKITLP